MRLESRISSGRSNPLSPRSPSVCSAWSSQFATPWSCTSWRTWCSLDISYTRPLVCVFETSRPACANVLGVQMSKNVPPPPSRHPQARVLAVPAAVEVGVGRVGVVVRVLAPAVRPGRPVAAEEAHVVHHRRCAGHPLRGHRPRVDAVRVEPDADHDRRAALRRLEERLRRPDALEGRRAVRQRRAASRSGAGRRARCRAAGGACR